MEPRLYSQLQLHKIAFEYTKVFHLVSIPKDEIPTARWAIAALSKGSKAPYLNGPRVIKLGKDVGFCGAATAYQTL